MKDLLASQPTSIIQQGSRAQGVWPLELERIALWQQPDGLTVALYTKSSGMSHLKQFAEAAGDVVMFARHLARWLRGIPLFGASRPGGYCVAAAVAAVIAVRASAH